MRKVVIDTAGARTEVPMNVRVEIRAFGREAVAVALVLPTSGRVRHPAREDLGVLLTVLTGRSASVGWCPAAGAGLRLALDQQPVASQAQRMMKPEPAISAASLRVSAPGMR